MGLRDWLSRLVAATDSGLTVEELAGRLGVDEAELRALRPAYREFEVPKRSGGKRRICAPEPELKVVQRRILRRLLRRLPAHACATGFERGHSIASNAVFHAGQAVIVRMDLKRFFDATRAKRVREYFRRIGWNRDASELLARLCTHGGGLPQGAPTSPRLSNLVNHRLDARLAGLADKLGAAYSRYADDMTFSFASDQPKRIHELIHLTDLIVRDSGYILHRRRKLHIRRRHQRQVVTGLVVNQGVNLPRDRRRRLRAIEHHLSVGRQATLTPEQLDGWRSLQSMVARQAGASDPG